VEAVHPAVPQGLARASACYAFRVVDKLGKYEVVDKIGVGGFGVVYKGYDPFIKRHVAIKTCSAEDTETRERFLREAEIAGNLQHRNIVTVFEFGFQEDVPYLVQEFLTGEDLDHKIKRRDAIPLAEKIAWLIEVARGLEFAHRRGVVHRDIKPANIRILHDSNAKILDFGIAKLAQQQSNLTQAGVTLGTASYLAPEQIRGEEVDGRTDIFSFGVLAYELLTYERPFRAQEISALFYKLINETPPPPSSRTAGIPAELERIVLRCLEKNRDKRYKPTEELVRALERVAVQVPGGSPAARAAFEHTPNASSGEQTSVYDATQAMTMAPAGDAATFASEPTITTKTPSQGHRLDEMVLHTHDHEEGATGAGRAAARKSRRTGRLVVAALLVAAAGAGGWLYSQGRLDSLLGKVIEPPPPPEPITSPVARFQGGSPAAAADGPLALALAGFEPPQPEAEAPPPPPPPGRLVVGPAWDPAMTVTVAGRSYRLDREQSIEAEPGNVSLSFAVATPDYSFDQSLRLRLKPGATERVSIPIERPGRLTVQPHLNTRGGTVRIDGAAAGPTPMRGRWLAPGDHFVEIFPLGGASEPGFSRSLAIRSGVDSVLTFDLDGKIEATVRERPIPAR